MASVTKRNDENAAPAEGEPDGDDARVEPPADRAGKANKPVKAGKAGKSQGQNEPKPIEYAARPAAGPGFFTIYKSGQGYWTRMGTLIGTGVLGLMLAYTLYDKIPPFFSDQAFGRRVGLGVALGFLVVY